MVDFIEILTAGYREYITDVAIEEYFQMKSFEVNKINNARINSRKLSHYTKFVIEVKKLIEETRLLDIVNENCHRYTTREILQIIDQKILYVLNKVRKFVEGLYRNMPYS